MAKTEMAARKSHLSEERVYDSSDEDEAPNVREKVAAKSKAAPPKEKPGSSIKPSTG